MIENKMQAASEDRMRVLVACEESQAVCREFRKLGHEAFSCDIEPCSGGHPEWHIQGDVLPLQDGSCSFWTQSGDWHMVIGEWDMILAFPPCTHLASSGAKHFAKKRADGRQQQGIDFFMAMVNAKCGRIMVENPVGIMSTVYRKPDQIIQPWMFGDRVQKTTCLWLKGLEPLVPWVTEKPEMEYHEFVREKDGSPARMAMWMYETRCLPYRERGKAASRTFKGIARAMAQSWGKTQEVEA